MSMIFLIKSAVCDVKVFLGEHLRSEIQNFDERI